MFFNEKIDSIIHYRNGLDETMNFLFPSRLIFLFESILRLGGQQPSLSKSYQNLPLNLNNDRLNLIFKNNFKEEANEFSTKTIS